MGYDDPLQEAVRRFRGNTIISGMLSPYPATPFPAKQPNDVEESRLNVAQAHPGVNVNAFPDDQAYDEASGTAVFCGRMLYLRTLAALLHSAQSPSEFSRSAAEFRRTERRKPKHQTTPLVQPLIAP